jgi:hypothetical protein
MTKVPEEVVARTILKMEVFRSTLPPGVYCFGTATGTGSPEFKIEERKISHKSPIHEQALGVVFGFWPDGFGKATITIESFAVTPPPLLEVTDLIHAPEPFLAGLDRHVTEKIVFVTNRHTRGNHPAPEKLVERATAVLEKYGRTLTPAVYRFYAEMAGGKRTGKIIEERRDFPDKKFEAGGPAFGFWPTGYTPEKFTGILEPMRDFPPIPGLSRLSQAPDEFLEDLMRHVGRKIGL